MEEAIPLEWRPAGGGLRDINISNSRRQYAHAQQTAAAV